MSDEISSFVAKVSRQPRYRGEVPEQWTRRSIRPTRVERTRLERQRDSVPSLVEVQTIPDTRLQWRPIDRPDVWYEIGQGPETPVRKDRK